ncbi:hypothetical protein WJX84_002819 [Apatococcus fuscideae]|uniref:Diphthamide biosynthesis protein 3 n=1 Tax=Apatococcus fuscideae TaxID=2026836 RepID=A0AAW1SYZ3_9CHLO
MSYDDIEIEDMEWSDNLQAFTYPCPCGDLFQISREELQAGEECSGLWKILQEAPASFLLEYTKQASKQR